jgi:hypothetical protein
MMNLKESLDRRFNRLKPRRFRCYCIGAAKTGTTSIASSFSQFYRAQHEPETQQTNRLIIHYLEGEISKKDLQASLVKRDRRLRLEMESAHPLGYASGVLADTFPDALFIVTLREPLSWLRSRLNFHYKNNPPAWVEYRNYFWVQRHKGFAPEELPLQNYGLCSLDTYLSQYADHYARVLTEVPEERRMLLRTSEINDRLPDIAKFLGVNPDKLLTSHSKRSDNKIRPLDEIDNAFVKERIMYHCGDLISQFFPEKLEFYT